MSNLDTLRVFIKNAPEAVKVLAYPSHKIHVPPDKHNAVTIGIRGEGFEICNECWSRIIRRGCSIPKPNQVLWSDTDEVPNCDLKEFH